MCTDSPERIPRAREVTASLIFPDTDAIIETPERFRVFINANIDTVLEER